MKKKLMDIVIALLLLWNLKLIWRKNQREYVLSLNDLKVSNQSNIKAWCAPLAGKQASGMWWCHVLIRLVSFCLFYCDSKKKETPRFSWATEWPHIHSNQGGKSRDKRTPPPHTHTHLHAEHDWLPVALAAAESGRWDQTKRAGPLW